MRRALLAVTVLLGALLTPAPAVAETNYKILPGVERLRDSYVIKFASEGTARAASPYLRPAAQELREHGLDLRVDGASTEPVCTDGVIWVARKYRPLSDHRSRGWPCVIDGTVVGGVILLNSEVRPLGGTLPYPDWVMRGLAAHELGHALGLDHVAGRAVMNPDRDAWSHDHPRYTPADLAGLDQLRGK